MKKNNIVKDIDVTTINSVSDLLKSFLSVGGFMAQHLGKAYAILRDILSKNEVTVFMSFPADIVATGLRGVIRDMVKLGYVDVIITTCGTWDHDIARTFKEYYLGSFFEDDKMLADKNIHRLGNILVPRDSYGKIIEEKVQAILRKLYRNGIKSLSTYELSWYLGESLDKSSILWWCKSKGVPVIVPAPYDGAVGSQIWIFQQFHRDFKLDLKADEDLLSDLVFDSKETAAVIVGGGVSKHHLLWWNQFRGGLDYAIQITSAVELDGSLSGARLDEAISWGKVKKEARNVSIWGEASVILPLLVSGLYRDMGVREKSG